MPNPRALRILRQHVRTDQLLGADAVPQGATLPLASPPLPAARGSTVILPSNGLALPTTTPQSQISNPKSQISNPKSQILPPLPRAARLEVLEALDLQVRACTRCSLCQSRTQTVFGEGDPEARLMFIGEGPGQTEDELGRPFVGRAGELLNKQIAAMGLRREEVFIANVVKCRPPENRTPTPQEVQACGDFLRQQILTIRPEVIITLGGPATKMILNTSEGITKIRGQWASYQGLQSELPDHPGVPVMPTFHPAYLLRSYTVENRQRVWSDLQQVMQRLNLPAKS